MGKVRVTLTHRCHKMGCEGVPGDVVEVDEKLADDWLSNGGCRMATEQDEATFKAKKEQAAKEKAAAAAREKAAKAEAAKERQAAKKEAAAAETAK